MIPRIESIYKLLRSTRGRSPHTDILSYAVASMAAELRRLIGPNGQKLSDIAAEMEDRLDSPPDHLDCEPIELFQGHGPAATRLRQHLELTKLICPSGVLSLVGIHEAIDAADYGPATEGAEYEELRELLESLQVNLSSLPAFAFTKEEGQSRRNIQTGLYRAKKPAPGRYAAIAGEIPSNRIQYCIFLDESVTVYIKHPYEDIWVRQTSLFVVPGLLKSVTGETASLTLSVGADWTTANTDATVIPNGQNKTTNDHNWDNIGTDVQFVFSNSKFLPTNKGIYLRHGDSQSIRVSVDEHHITYYSTPTGFRTLCTRERSDGLPAFSVPFSDFPNDARLSLVGQLTNGLAALIPHIRAAKDAVSSAVQEATPPKAVKTARVELGKTKPNDDGQSSQA